jgi:hypothetical protein
MDLWYSEAALAISEYLNGCGFPFDRTRSLHRQYWWNTLSGAAYNILKEHFDRKQIVIQLDPLHRDWLIRRAYSRRTSCKGMSAQDMVLYDIVDILGYYNTESYDNPPLGYIIPEAFQL